MANRSERASAAALVIVLHAAVITLVMLSRSSRPIVEKRGLIAFSIPDNNDGEPRRQISQPHQPRLAEPLPAAPAPLVQITSIDFVQIPGPVSPETSLDALAQDMPAAVGGACDLTQPVQDALRHSDEVARQLPTIAPDLRSVANAIVVWNAGWVAPAAGPAQAAFTAIRRTITQTVAASSADCRSQLQRGPRLIYLPGSGQFRGNPGKTTVLALGSGQWSWQQLIDGAQPSPVDQGNTASPPAFAHLAAATAQISTPADSAGQAASPNMNALLASLIRKRSPTALPYYP